MSELIQGVVMWAMRALLLWVFWNYLFPAWINLPTLTYWQAGALIGIRNVIKPSTIDSEHSRKGAA